MTDIDDSIRAGLDADDRAFLESLDSKRGLFRQASDALHGPMRKWMFATGALTFAVSILGLYAIWGFLEAESIDSLIRWAALGWVAWTVQIALKQWMWDRINMISILREVKRLELQVAMLREERG